MPWKTLLALGVIASGCALGCTVTLTDQPNGRKDGGATGGTTGSGGASSTGGAETGGAVDAATGGTSGSADGGGTAGSASGGDSGTRDSGAVACSPTTAPDSCNKCLQEKCCSEWLNCNDNACAGNGTTTGGELLSFQDCIDKQILDGGSTQIDVKCKSCSVAGNGLFGAKANAVIECLSARTGDSGAGPSNCSADCFGQEIR